MISFVIGFEDELNWSQVPSQVVMKHALNMTPNSHRLDIKEFGYMLY